MATVTLGSIKFNWKGAYNSSTAYAVDDVVSSGGNSYVCIQAHTNQAVGNATAYWNIMSAAGTNGTNGSNGTDVGTTITTQGDILYRDGSGLQRLAAGTSGQFLKTLGTGANPTWGTVTTAVLGMSSFTTTTRNTNLNSSSYVTYLNGNFTKSSASSKITIIATYSQYSEANGAGTAKFAFGSNNVYSGTSYGNTSGHQKMVTNQFHIPNNTQTGSLTWSFNIKAGGGSIFLPSSVDDSRIDNSREAVVTITEHL
tara:strand:+ start:4128 stop:4892 length:765 start_codon:yes stop_codon:yes gene_type:complete